jgi:hypothetical protein
MQLGKANFDFIDEVQPYVGKPMSLPDGAPAEQVGTLRKFRVTTTDKLDHIFGIVEWPQADPEVISIQRVEGESKYERLERAGRMGLMTKFGDFWLVELTAMKFNPQNERVNLAGADLSALDYFLGSSLEQALLAAGANAVGSRQALVGDESKNRRVLAMKCPKGSYEAVAMAFVVTRVLAIMHDFGMSV